MKPASTLPTAITAALDRGGRVLDGISRKAKELASAMEEAHGGTWRIQIDHECKMIVIVQRARDQR